VPCARYDAHGELATMTVDGGRLDHAFVNLLSNAINYSDPNKADRRVWPRVD
jgi:signal transduction histidine kinase